MNHNDALPHMQFNVTEEEAGERIDRWIANKIQDDVSRTQIQQWIKNGNIVVNGDNVKPNYKVAAEDAVDCTIPEVQEMEIVPEDIPLDVYYEDEDLIIVNKPRGMVVHPALGHYSGTLVNALLHHCKDLSGINGVIRPGIVHRIDKDTSGLIVAAKNDKAHQSLSAQWKDRDVDRKYIAIVHGVLSHNEGTINAPLGRDDRDRKMFAVTEKNSKHAITHFALLEQYDKFAMVECKLETGRTHQIRVHMKFIGHHLVGDPMYGRTKDISFPGQALHAAKIGFRHPRTNEWLAYEAPLPEDMKELIARVKS
ncbi:RluA family pseudouridine synthase [Longirhabdus pacifica]|uniref:RluA family pseudouridine synthase n=1 Tax=Longirhabdus pacifica TaxID=2305227 RepID=UPI001F0C44B5|nr:RluA family pseudouridine synthase [Longirhabdus pacifica]